VVIGKFDQRSFGWRVTAMPVEDQDAPEAKAVE
jgi:hypothetical protein